MKSKSSSTFLYLAAAVVVVALIGFAVTKERAPSVYDGFAQCLSENNVKMFGAWWCPHCEDQKAEFGSAFDHIDYVECSTPGSRAMSAVCRNEGIEGYPTWEFADGTRQAGVQSFQELAEATGCELPDQG